ncbi:hypothetical protein [Futiania mangrovi]|uniref:Uncharacterized protein n=1 Tax=Futiania mangrovi TaxID=2959716 RepID=A0A9J6PFW8_9PROT|nr:hypothetical protein [Futiania mangrovii]MCP1335511.1 hypothetical protein [Futiania mangrovii]
MSDFDGGSVPDAMPPADLGGGLDDFSLPDMTGPQVQMPVEGVDDFSFSGPQVVDTGGYVPPSDADFTPNPSMQSALQGAADDPFLDTLNGTAPPPAQIPMPSVDWDAPADLPDTVTYGDPFTPLTPGTQPTNLITGETIQNPMDVDGALDDIGAMPGIVPSQPAATASIPANGPVISDLALIDPVTGELPPDPRAALQNVYTDPNTVRIGALPEGYVFPEPDDSPVNPALQFAAGFAHETASGVAGTMTLAGMGLNLLPGDAGTPLTQAGQAYQQQIDATYGGPDGAWMQSQSFQTGAMTNRVAGLGEATFSGAAGTASAAGRAGLLDDLPGGPIRLADDVPARPALAADDAPVWTARGDGTFSAPVAPDDAAATVTVRAATVADDVPPPGAGGGASLLDGPDATVAPVRLSGAPDIQPTVPPMQGGDAGVPVRTPAQGAPSAQYVPLDEVDAPDSFMSAPSSTGGDGGAEVTQALNSGPRTGNVFGTGVEAPQTPSVIRDVAPEDLPVVHMKRGGSFYQDSLALKPGTDGFVWTPEDLDVSMVTQLSLPDSGSLTLYPQTDVGAVLDNDAFRQNALTPQQTAALEVLDANPDLRALAMPELIPADQLDEAMTRQILPAMRELGTQALGTDPTNSIEFGTAYARPANQPDAPYRLVGFSVGGSGEVSMQPQGAVLDSSLSNFDLVTAHTHPIKATRDGQLVPNGFFSSGDIGYANARMDQQLADGTGGRSVTHTHYGAGMQEGTGFYRYQLSGASDMDYEAEGLPVYLTQPVTKQVNYIPEADGSLPPETIAFDDLGDPMGGRSVVPTGSLVDPQYAGTATIVPPDQHYQTWARPEDAYARLLAPPEPRTPADAAPAAVIQPAQYTLPPDAAAQITQLGGGSADAQVLEGMIKEFVAGGASADDVDLGEWIGEWQKAGVVFGDTLPEGRTLDDAVRYVHSAVDVAEGYADVAEWPDGTTGLDELPVALQPREEVFEGLRLISADNGSIRLSNPNTGETLTVDGFLSPQQAADLKGKDLHLEVEYDPRARTWELLDIGEQD